MALDSDRRTLSTQNNFHEFYSKWKDEQRCHLDILVTASRASENPRPDPDSDPDSDSDSLSGLVARMMANYEKYYTMKSKWAETDVLLVLSPPWNSSLEDAFVWVGGWRPTTAFHLLYSKSGLQFEARLSDLIEGVQIGDLGDLSSEQISLIDKLQRNTVKVEREITEKVAKQQEKVADMEMVELSHAVTELTQLGSNDDDQVQMERVESALKTKEDGFQVILQKADDLRLQTLKAVVEILSPIQAIHFLIAATELQMRLHDWGKQKDERQGNNRMVV